MTSQCRMTEESERGIRKWEEMWFKITAEDGERGATVTCDGRLFHRRAAATGNALSPIVDRRVRRTSRDVDEAERSCVAWVSAGRRRYMYVGASPCWHLYAKTLPLYSSFKNFHNQNTVSSKIVLQKQYTIIIIIKCKDRNYTLISFSLVCSKLSISFSTSLSGCVESTPVTFACIQQTVGLEV